jgi:transcriptional regulator with XRE-family HTH domain
MLEKEAVECPIYDWMLDQKKLNRKFTNRQFAKAIGITECYLSAIAQFRFRPKFEILLKIEEFTKGAINAVDILYRFVKHEENVPRGKPGRKSKEKNNGK